MKNLLLKINNFCYKHNILGFKQCRRNFKKRKNKRKEWKIIHTLAGPINDFDGSTFC